MGNNVGISELRVSNGADFFVAIEEEMICMPGLSQTSAAERIEISDDGVISGLF